MKIAVIGAGFTGLAAAYRLVQAGHEVDIFEKAKESGGLAVGFQNERWLWTLEKHYHHWFINDLAIINLAHEIGHQVVTKRPKTSVYLNNQIYQLDSPLNVLKLDKLKFWQRLYMGFGLFMLRYNPWWKPLERFNAHRVLPYLLGKSAYKLLWQPLLTAKFGQDMSEISLAWFWARISKRTSSLAYPFGGYLALARTLEGKIKELGGKIYFNAGVGEIICTNFDTIKIKYIDNQKKNIVETTKIYDKVLLTLPTNALLHLVPQFPKFYKEKLKKLRGIGAINLVLRLKKEFFTDKTYWLSICDTKAPVLAIIEHTNFMDKKYFNDEHILYLGNYLPPDHKFFDLEKQELLKIYDPYLRKINRNYRKYLIDYDMFKAPFAQPIYTTNYSKLIPSIKTPLKSVYLANVQQVYPWDRGTTYAVELGEDAAKLMLNKI